MNKQESHIISGMSRDMAVNQFNNKLAYDAKNIRITARDGNSTLLSVSNERGTQEVTLNSSLLGTPIGFSVLNNYLVLFTTTNTAEDNTHTGTDHIYRIKFSDTEATGEVLELFSGSLNFSTKYPIETLPLYENESIQKVYWVDGRNQPRVINIVDGPITGNSDVVNFSREVNLQHTYSVTKRNTGGLFSAGTVQYAFSYFNKFGQESKIFDYTPLYYLSPKERGLQADQTSSCSFQVTLKNLDTNFQYVRFYAIVRSSANATPNCRIVGDYPISDVPTPATIGTMEAIDNPTKELPGYKNLYIYSTLDGSLTYLYEYDQPWGGNTEEETFKLSLDRTQYLVDTATNIAYQCEDDLYVNCFLRSKNYSLQAVEGGTQPSENIGTLYSGAYTPGIQSRGASLVDNGSYGSTIDATALLFVGGENIIASTIAQKDNTLFLGNIVNNKPNVGDIKLDDGTQTLKEYARSSDSRDELKNIFIDYEGNSSDVDDVLSDVDGVKTVTKTSYSPTKKGFYNYEIDNNRNSQQIKRFKYGETYRLGFVAQYKDGSWSEVIWIGDEDNSLTPRLSKTYYYTGGWKYTLPVEWRNKLIAKGFKRIAPVVVFPTLADRNILCQGILLPTVYNVGDRNTNSPFVQSSWFVRQSTNMGISPNESLIGEIQISNSLRGLDGPVVYDQANKKYISNEDFVSAFNEMFLTDYSILTFHSPEIEFNEGLQQSAFDGLKVRIVGISTLDSGKVKYYITTKSIGCADASKVVKGGDLDFVFAAGTINNSNLHPGMFMDGAVDVGNDEAVVLKSGQDEMYGWCVYPWHRLGSLNNQKPLSTKQANNGYARTAELQHKILGRLSYATTNYEFFAPVYMKTRAPQLFNSDQVAAIKIPEPLNSSLGNLVYYGNIDKVLTPNYVNLSNTQYTNYNWIEGTGTYAIQGLSIDKTQGYPINFLWFKYIGTDATRRADQWSMSDVSDIALMERNGRRHALQGNSWVIWDGRWRIYDEQYYYGKDPVSMKYKSTPHAVIALDYQIIDDNVTQMCIPQSTLRYTDTATNIVVDYGANAFWNNGSGARYVTSYDINYYDEEHQRLPVRGVFIAELYRDTVSSLSRFGGVTDTALVANMWLKCGDAVDLSVDGTIEFKEGDTYLARYDCLKTYSFTNEDTNSIIEVYSTEVESRVNLDERTDRNRGLSDNTILTRQNFNLFNHAGYEQDSNYFNYQAIDYDRFKSLSYPNMITWSLEKTLGEEVDKWTSMDLTSTMDLDGDKGEVTSLNVFNNEIYAFQNRGFAQLLFNSRVQIPTSDGQPIEITNGLKMQGKRYISSMIGCTNKWSIQETPSGLYFMDDESNAVYRFGGTLEDISTKCGMKSWFDAHGSFDKWTPDEFKNIITFYDKSNADIYFVAKDWSLVYSEQMGQFTSFMDYNNLPVIVGVKDGMYAFNKVGTDNKAWKMFSWDYNSFFGSDKPYWMTFIANSNPTMDKVFNNLEFRADMWDGETFVPLETFDRLQVWNEHQNTGEVTLTTASSGIPSNLKKKFNVWRINVPRDMTKGADGKPINFGMNRIRNPWAYINLKCSKEQASEHRRLQFTDLLVNYFI